MRQTKPVYSKPSMGRPDGKAPVPLGGKGPVTGGGMPRPNIQLPMVKKPGTNGPTTSQKAMKMDSIQRRLTGG